MVNNLIRIYDLSYHSITANSGQFVFYLIRFYLPLPRNVVWTVKLEDEIPIFNHKVEDIITDGLLELMAKSTALEIGR